MMFFNFLILKENPSISTWDAFYDQEENTVDILFIGNSHIGNGLDLNIINAKTKSKTNTLYGYGQTLPQVYYNLKEALKYQNPKLIVLETYTFSNISKDYFYGQDRIPKMQGFEAKKLSKLKIEEYLDLYENEEVLNFFPFITYHSNWNKKGLVKENIIKKLNPKSNYYFGDVKSVQTLDKKKIEAYRKKDFGNKKYYFSKWQLSYFNKISELAKEKNIPILLVTIPYFKEYRNKINYKHISSALVNIAKESKYNYIDLNGVYPDLDYHYFMNDAVRANQHLNYKGNILVSNYIADYINKEYDFNFENSNESLPEYFLYNNIKKNKLNNGATILGDINRFNDIKRNTISVAQEDGNITIEGWTVIKDQNSDDKEIFIGLKNENNFIYVSRPEQFESRERKDVSKFFKKEDLYDNSGFYITLNTLLLEKGNYEVFMIIRDSEGEVLVKKSNKRIEII